MRKTGELALHFGFIRPHQLNIALQEQRENAKKESFRRVLLRLKFITEKEYQLLTEAADREERKHRICRDWINRYTGIAPEEHGKTLLFTNFFDYLNIACDLYDIDPGKISNLKLMMPSVKLSDDISLICTRMGSPNIALAIDIFAAIEPKCILFIGKCGGIKRSVRIGDFILPSSAIRAEGTSNDYLDPAVPVLPAFPVQEIAAKEMAREELRYLTGVVHTTNRRLWEFDQHFCRRLVQEKVIAVDMETATFFAVAFANKIPGGALLMVSDLPLAEVKTTKKDRSVSRKYAHLHINLGCKTLRKSMQRQQLKHFDFGVSSITDSN